MWEHFRHQADIGVRGIGDTLEEAFAEGAYALLAVICDPRKVEPKEEIAIEARVPDIELLFAEWLNKLIAEMDTRRMLFSRFEVHIEGDTLTARAWGEQADPDRHDISVDVKAATYQMLSVTEEAGKWTAQCVVDV
jgi:tRNA nucleotidyltransferase (CCA-adding enzyme)